MVDPVFSVIDGEPYFLAPVMQVLPRADGQTELAKLMVDAVTGRAFAEDSSGRRWLLDGSGDVA